MIELMDKNRIIAIFRNVPFEKVIQTAKALYDGGIRLMEVTMNSADFIETMQLMKKELPEDVRVGAGTVVDLESAIKAITADAEYIVAPNTDVQVIKYCVSNNIPVFPGAMTPSEVMVAYKAGCTAVKLFPMGTLGLSYLKEIKGPLDSVPLVITGGVNVENVVDFVNAGASYFGIGSSLLKKDLISQCRFEELKELAARFVSAAGGNA